MVHTHVPEFGRGHIQSELNVTCCAIYSVINLSRVSSRVGSRVELDLLSCVVNVCLHNLPGDQPMLLCTQDVVVL